MLIILLKVENQLVVLKDSLNFDFSFAIFLNT